SALTVLACFIVIGLLDTVHFRPLLPDSPHQGVQKIYSTEVLSLLDVWLKPLREQVEKTYSAPLSAHLYAKETIETADGGQVREFPRLIYGGAQLQDPESELLADVWSRALLGAGSGLILWIVAM